MRIAWISLFALAFSLSAATAKQQSTTTEILADNWMLSHLPSFARLRSGITLAKANRQIKIKFERMDIDGGGISPKDHELQEKIQQAQMRARAISRWAKHDLDGDGHIIPNALAVD